MPAVTEASASLKTRISEIWAHRAASPAGKNEIRLLRRFRLWKNRYEEPTNYRRQSYAGPAPNTYSVWSDLLYVEHQSDDKAHKKMGRINANPSGLPGIALTPQ